MSIGVASTSQSTSRLDITSRSKSRCKLIDLLLVVIPPGKPPNSLFPGRTRTCIPTPMQHEMHSDADGSCMQATQMYLHSIFQWENSVNGKLHAPLKHQTCNRRHSLAIWLYCHYLVPGASDQAPSKAAQHRLISLSALLEGVRREGERVEERERETRGVCVRQR